MNNEEVESVSWCLIIWRGREKTVLREENIEQSLILPFLLPFSPLILLLHSIFSLLCLSFYSFSLSLSLPLSFSLCSILILLYFSLSFASFPLSFPYITPFISSLILSSLPFFLVQSISLFIFSQSLLLSFPANLCFMQFVSLFLLPSHTSLSFHFSPFHSNSFQYSLPSLPLLFNSLYPFSSKCSSSPSPTFVLIFFPTPLVIISPQNFSLYCSVMSQTNLSLLSPHSFLS